MRTKFSALLFGTLLLSISGVAFAADAGCAPLTGLQIAAGYVTFANIVKLIASLGAVAFAWVFFGDVVKRLLMVFVHIPLAFYKVLGYLASVACVGWAWAVVNGYGTLGVGGTSGISDAVDVARYVGMVGALGLATSIVVSLADWAKIHGAGPHPERTTAGILTFLFVALALALHNPIVGAFAVIALMALYGFMIVVLPGLVEIGYSNDKEVASGTLASFLVLIPATLAVAHYGSLGFLDVFRPGIFWVATFTGYTGLLILASFHFSRNFPRYVVMQVVMIVMGLAALYFGSVYSIGELQKIGGTFFVIYLLAKPWDLPKTNVMVWSGLGLFTCIALFLLMRHVGQHPDLWAGWLLF